MMFLSYKIFEKRCCESALCSEKYAIVEGSILITYPSNILGIFFTGKQCPAPCLSKCNKIVLFHYPERTKVFHLLKL